MENTETFGGYIRSLRLQRDIGQRQLARLLGMSPSYLNDIEKEKRNAPKADTVRAMSQILEADENQILDLASRSRNDVAADIAKMVQDSPETVALLRTINDYRPTEDQIRGMRKTLMAASTKAIIIAAGLGSRMKELTKAKPKCMAEFGDKTLLQRQIETYYACGIKDISLVRGYKKEVIDYDGITYFDNDDYADNNILNSLFYAEDALNGHVIAAYSDILFESHVVNRLLESKHDISIVVDINWRGYYVDRRDHPIEEAENVIFDANNKVVEIGKILTDKTDVHGEFIGMIKMTPKGAEIFKRHFHQAKALYWDKPFQRASVFQKAYLTDMVQEMVNLGVPVHCVIIERGWKEIDTVEDYEKALQDFG